MAEPQKTTSVPDISLNHRLTATATLETDNANATPEIGDKMEDGTIYAGVSPDTGEAMYVTPADASGTLKWKQAMQYAADLDANGHKDWKLPTKAELNVLFKNCAKIDGFNEGASYPACWYWSSTQSRDFMGGAWMQRFSSDGNQVCYSKGLVASVRPVRSELRPV